MPDQVFFKVSNRPHLHFSVLGVAILSPDLNAHDCVLWLIHSAQLRHQRAHICKHGEPDEADIGKNVLI